MRRKALKHTHKNLEPSPFGNTESGIHGAGIRNPAPGIRNPQCGIQNPKLSWIPLHGARLTFNVKVESGSTFTFNASRSYNLLYFIYARKVSQMLLRNLRKIYATVEIHLKS